MRPIRGELEGERRAHEAAGRAVEGGRRAHEAAWAGGRRSQSRGRERGLQEGTAGPVDSSCVELRGRGFDSAAAPPPPSPFPSPSPSPWRA
eukprot:3202580-Prymnesium_polylepis.1